MGTLCQVLEVKVKVLVALVMSNSLPPHGLSSVRLICPWNSTGVGCHSLLQGIFLTQGLNLVFLHCRQIHYYLSYQDRLHPAPNA